MCTVASPFSCVASLTWEVTQGQSVQLTLAVIDISCYVRDANNYLVTDYTTVLGI